MKNDFYIGLILLSCASICLGMKFNLDVEDLKYEMSCKEIKKDREIDDLKKEIKLLKQDLFNLRYGYDVGKE